MDLFDSTQMLLLHNYIERLQGMKMPAIFLFNYTSPRSVCRYFFGASSDATESIRKSYTISESKCCRDIAIVGMSCRLPGGVESPAMFWDLLREGKSTMRKIPYSRWDIDAEIACDKSINDMMARCICWGSFLHDLDLFDASFFGISAAEASVMDPQQRLLLECAHLAFIDAGYSKESLHGRNVGVFVGMMSVYDAEDIAPLGRNTVRGVFAANSTDHATAAGRISFVFGLQGPCSVYSTACSSSLVALHAAVKCLEMGECDLAIVLGANIIITPGSMKAFSAAGMISPTGRCHTFDSSADGYARGEGCGAVVLKRMEQVVADGDHVYAVVKGVGVAQDGKSASLTAPNGLAQEKLLRSTLANAGLSGEEVDYLEAHGTGTPLGDPIEIGALANALCKHRSIDQPLVLGAVKANIGHLEAAAGIVGLIKAVLVLQHEQAPPNSELKTLNPKIVQLVGNLPIHFPVKLESLRKQSGIGQSLERDESAFSTRTLLAGVSSFGFAGTIAHAIVSQSPPEIARRITTSAAGGSVQEGREAVFLFAGQGSQYEGMGQGLYESEEVFRESMDKCEAVYLSLTGESLLNVIYPTVGTNDTSIGKNSPLNETCYAQPALFALEWSLACMWGTKGVKPLLVLGHSVGELVAACVSGVMSMESGMKLATERGRLMQSLPINVGVMVALRCSEAEVRAAIRRLDENLAGRVCLGAVNGPRNVVLSGSEDAVATTLKVLGVVGHRLRVSHAFHSPLMESILDAYRLVVETVNLSPARIPFASTVTGGVIFPEDHFQPLTNPEYWVSQVISPVLFYKALESTILADTIWNQSFKVLLEVSPNPVLTDMSRAWVKGLKGDTDLKWVCTLNRKSAVSDSSAVQVVLSELLGEGGDKTAKSLLDIVFPHRKYYPWQQTTHPLLQQTIASFDEETTIYRAVFHVGLMAIYKDHSVQGQVIFPGTGYLEMALAAVSRKLRRSDMEQVLCLRFMDVACLKPLHLAEGTPLVCEVSEYNSILFCNKLGYADRTVYCTIKGAITTREVPLDSNYSTRSLTDAKSECPIGIPGVSERYMALQDEGFHGPQFQVLWEVWRNEIGDSLVSRLRVPEESDRYYFAHPALLDGAFQLCCLFKSMTEDRLTADEIDAWVPAAIGSAEMECNGALTVGTEVWVEARCVKSETRSLICDINLFHPVTGKIIMHLTGVRFALFVVSSPKVGLYQLKWRAIEQPPTIEAERILHSVDVVGPGWENFDFLNVEYFGSAGLDVCHVGATVDVEAWEKVDTVLVPVFLYAVQGIDGLQDLVWKLISLINYLSSLHRQYLTIKSRIRVAIVFAQYSRDVTSTEDTRTDGGSLIGTILGLIRTARLELDSTFLLTCICSDEDTRSKRGLSTLASQIYHEVSLREHFDRDVMYHKGERMGCRLQEISPISRSYSLPRLCGVALVTGGLGGLGIVTAEALIETGMRCLILASRSGKVKYSDQNLENRLQRLINCGAKVVLETCDMSDESQVEALLARVRFNHGPLQVIVHAAGVLADKTLSAQTSNSVDHVWGAKAHGAWFLHKYTQQDKELQAFILYSSVASLFGSVGQANYATANAFLDELARYRVKLGLPAVSMQWSAVLGVGMAAAMDEPFRIPRSHSVSAGIVKRVVKQMLSGGEGSARPVQAVLPKTMLNKRTRTAQLIPLLGEIVDDDFEDEEAVTKDNIGRKIITSKWQDMNADEARQSMLAHVTSLVKALLGYETTVQLDPNYALMHMGLDSLASMQLVQQLESNLSFRLSSTLLFAHPTINSLVDYLVGLVQTTSKNSRSSVALYSGTSRLSLKSGVSSLAIIGMSCRLPGDINSLDALYEALSTKRSTSSKTPLTRWDSHAIMCELGYEDKDLLNRINHGSFLSDSVINSFDNKQFGISSAEASEMDPSQRLLLTVAREALMDTGMSLESLRGRRVGVYLGIMMTAIDHSTYEQKSSYEVTGKSLSIAAGRISFVFDFNGPCMTIDTACSSSLVALHVAHQSLEKSECEMALVIAVNVLTLNASVSIGAALMTSPDGICHSFDQSANGYCRAEGCLAVVLMPQDAAMNSALGMYALVKGSAVQQDGTSASLTAPNGRAQVQLMKEALSNAGVSAKDVGLVEAHGTGTSLGDPIEVEALVSVYGSDSGRDGSRPLQVTSVKGNIGHLEAAAGLAGLFAVVVALQKKQSAPNAQLKILNEKVVTAVEEEPIVFPRELTPLIRASEETSLYAGLSSFGYSGTIAHVILGEAPVGNVRPITSQYISADVFFQNMPSIRSAGHSLLCTVSQLSYTNKFIYKCFFHIDVFDSWLKDFLVNKHIEIPNGVYIEMCLAYFQEKCHFSSALEFVNFFEPLLPNDVLCLNAVSPSAVALIVSSLKERKSDFEIRSDDDLFALCCSGGISYNNTFDWRSLEARFAIDKDSCILSSLSPATMYENLRLFGLDLGPSFQIVKSCYSKEANVFVTEIAFSKKELLTSYVLSPMLIEAMTHPVLCTMAMNSMSMLPRLRSVDFIYLHHERISSISQCGEAYSYTTIREQSSNAFTVDSALLTSDGEAVLVMQGLRYSVSELTTLSAGYVILSSEYTESALLRRNAHPALESTIFVAETTRKIAELDHLLQDSFSIIDIIDTNVLLQEQHNKEEKHYDSVVIFLDDLAVDDCRFLSKLTDWLKVIDTSVSLSHRLLFVMFTSMCTVDATLNAFSYLVGTILCAQLEYKDVEMKLIQVDTTNIKEISHTVALELKAWDEEMFVFYMNGKREVKRHIKWTHKFSNDKIHQLFCGAYLITGGLGGLGLLSAKVLVDMGVRQLVLVSRSGLVHSDQGLEERLNWLLEESGADVRVMRCDVSDEASVEQLLERIRSIEGWNGGLEGIIHCAGLIRDGLIRGGQAALGAESVWKSKAYSAYLLDKHTRTDNLKMFVCYSSLSASIGLEGAASYCAANSFLDYLVQQRRGLGLSGLSVQWPMISGVGMAENLMKDRYSSDLFLSVEDVESLLRVFVRRCIENNISNSVLAIVPKTVLARVQRLRVGLTFSKVQTLDNDLSITPIKSKTIVSEPQDILSTVVEVLKALVNSEIRFDVPLMDLGVDSLGATELSTQLTAKIGVQLSPTLIYSYPTVTSIVNHISSLLSDHDKLSGEDNPVILRKNRLSLKSGVSSLAIIGMSCRLPGDINSLDALYEALSTKRSTSSKTPLTRWDSHAIMCELGYEDKDLLNRINHGAFLSDSVINSFDSKQFGISRAEASVMDPSQRLLLTMAREALMDTGMSLDSLRGRRVGVYVGLTGSIVDSGSRQESSNIKSVYGGLVGSTLAVAAGRISFVFDFNGPCMTIDTACSSSLVALHVAHQSLEKSECEMALVIAVNVLTLNASVSIGAALMTSPDGICHSFDQSANGYCRAEGCLAVVLMPQDAAMNSALGMYALVKGSAVQQDGTSASLTAPNGRAQVQLMKEALSNAGVSAKDVGLVEAHGTGTSLGDPIEVEALVSVYGSDSGRDGSRPLQVTSVKGNIGHLEAAAGLAGLFAVVVALQKKQSAPNAQLKILNEKVVTAVEEEPIVFPRELTPLIRASEETSLYAGLSSFGYSGTIAHVILGEAPVGNVRPITSQYISADDMIYRNYRKDMEMNEAKGKI